MPEGLLPSMFFPIPGKNCDIIMVVKAEDWAMATIDTSMTLLEMVDDGRNV